MYLSFFVEELIGYCLKSEPAKIYALQIRINYTNLNASIIHRHADTSEVENLLSIANLSNFVYFIRRSRFDGCFTNERNHVIFLDQGELFDHSFMDGQFLFPSIHVDGSCSKLHRVGNECGLATHCKGRVVRFDTREHIEQRSFPETEYGQIFFCLSGDFVRFQHEMLSLYDKGHQPFGNLVPFPFGEIYGGHCVNVDDKFFFVATIDNSGTVLVNFSDATYQHLGVSDLSTAVSARVKGDVAIVNNGSVTEVFSLDLACAPQPLVLHENNFILATFFTSETRDRFWCLDQGPAPAEVTTVTTPVSHTTPLSDPVNSQTENSSQGVVGNVVIGVAVSASVLLVLVLVVVVLVILGCAYKPHM